MVAPRTVLQLLLSLQRLGAALTITTPYRVAAALVRPAVQQLRLDLQQQTEFLVEGASAPRLGAPPLGRSCDNGSAAEKAVSSVGLYESVRLLGGLATAMAGLCECVERLHVKSQGRASHRYRVSGGGGHVSPRGPPPFDFRRTGLRTSLLEAGRRAVQAATAANAADTGTDTTGLPGSGGKALAAVDLRDWCTYLAGRGR